MKFTIYETNSNRSEKYSRAETIEAVSLQKAAESYQEEFRLAAQTSHLQVTAEGGDNALIALRGVSPPTVAEVRPAFTAVNRETPSPISEETCGWSTFCTVIGWINLLLGVIGLFMLGGGGSDRASGRAGSPVSSPRRTARGRRHRLARTARESSGGIGEGRRSGAWRRTVKLPLAASSRIPVRRPAATIRCIQAGGRVVIQLFHGAANRRLASGSGYGRKRQPPGAAMAEQGSVAAVRGRLFCCPHVERIASPVRA